MPMCAGIQPCLKMSSRGIIRAVSNRGFKSVDYPLAPAGIFGAIVVDAGKASASAPKVGQGNIYLHALASDLFQW